MYLNEMKVSKGISNHTNYTCRFSWLNLIRPMTFTGTISPILAGTAIAAKKGPIRIELLLILLTAALFVQTTANLLNDYFDFKNGQDLEKWAGPDDSAYRQGPHHSSLPYAAWLMITLAAVLGIWLASQSSYWIILIGLLGIIFAYLYSGGPRPLSAIGLGELTAAFFLGFIPAFLAYFVQVRKFDIQIFVIFVPFSLLISSMILTNNIRDLEKDRTFRRTLAMKLGRTNAVRLLALLLSASYLWVIMLIIFRLMAWTAILMIFALPLAIKLNRCFRPGAKRSDEIAAMKIAAWHHWAFGTLFAAGLWMACL